MKTWNKTGVTVLIVSFCLALLAGGIGYIHWDHVRKHTGVGPVIEKQYVRSHSQVRRHGGHMIGKVYVPGSTYTVQIPDKWYVTILEPDGCRSTVEVTQQDYNAMRHGQKVDIYGK